MIPDKTHRHVHKHAITSHINQAFSKKTTVPETWSSGHTFAGGECSEDHAVATAQGVAWLISWLGSSLVMEYSEYGISIEYGILCIVNC